MFCWSSFGVDGHDRHTRYLIYEGEYAKRIYLLMFSIFHGHYLTQNVKVSYFLINYELYLNFAKFDQTRVDQMMWRVYESFWTGQLVL
jgi:hypothetical protein